MEFRNLEVLHKAVRKDLKCKSDCLVAAIHALLMNKGFYCVGIGDENPIEDKDGGGGKRSEMFPDGWNDVEDVYLLRYVSDSNTRYLLKIVKSGDSTLLVNLRNIDTGKAAELQLDVQKHISENYKNFSDNYMDLDSLYQNFQSKISSKLKIDSDDQREAGSSSNVTVPENPEGSGAEGRSSPLQVEENPKVLPVGSRDLDPLGGETGGIGGGMLMDPSSVQGQSGPTRPELGIGGPQGLPEDSVPPGARFDPIGPVIPGTPGSVRPNPDNQKPKSDQLKSPRHQP